MVDDNTNDIKLNPPYKVRVGLYVVLVIGSPISQYLKAKGLIGDLETNLWAALVVAISTLAALNVKSQ